jgi:hypothetical protein
MSFALTHLLSHSASWRTKEVARKDRAAVLAQERTPAELDASRRWRDAGPGEHVAHQRRRDRDPELAQLVDDADIASVAVLARETQDQLAHLISDRWSPGPPVRICPAANHQLSMPAEECLRAHRENVPTAARQHPAQRCKQQPVVRLKPRLADLPAEDRQLMAEHENLELLLTIAAGEEHDQLQ